MLFIKKSCDALRVLLATLLVSWLFVIGCDEENSHIVDRPHRPHIGSVTLSIATDTLFFLPGDSASTTVTVIVSDRDGNVMEGVKVDVSLDPHHLGYIEFIDTELRDTTNAQGRVDLLFTAIGTAGDMIFTATAENILAWRELAIRQAIPLVGTIRITATPPVLSASLGDTVKVRICAVISDMEGNGLEGIYLLIGTCGEQQIPFPPTDSLGRACTDYVFVVVQEVYCLDIRFGDLLRSFYFHIDIADSSQSD